MCIRDSVSTGSYMSIITKATPLSGKSWGLSNRMTSRAVSYTHLGDAGENTKNFMEILKSYE